MSGARVEVHRGGPSVPWLGQLVPMDVQVWRPQGALPLEPFSLDDVVAAGLIAKWSAQAPPPDDRREGDTAFLVQHRTLLVFPQSEGELTLPPLVARWTDPGSKAAVAIASAPATFTAAIPDGAGDPLPLVASSVQLEQAFDRDLSDLRVGDGFTRTLTLRATDSDPIVFPELALPGASGLSSYPSAARAVSSSERGQIQAEETLRVTYVVERAGRHTLAGYALRWLEPGSGRYLEAGVPALTLWAAPNPSLGFQCLGTARGAAVATELGSLVLLALLGALAVRRVRRGPGRIERALERRSRERRAFREVLRAVRHGAPLAVLQRLYAWLAVRVPNGLDRTLAPLEVATPAASAACAALERQLFREPRAERAPRAWASALRRGRRALGRSRQRPDLEKSLNPVSTIKGES